MLIDSFGRQINYLRVSVTDRCNLRCLYCMPKDGIKWVARDEVLRFEEIREVVRAAVALGITRVRVTGGEPLVREDILELVRMLAEVTGLDDLSLTTNGTLLSRYAHALARAGLKRINISLDTLKPDRFRQITCCGAVEDVRQGIEAALSAGLNPVKLNVVIMRELNDDEILDMGKLTLDMPIHVRFIELMPLGDYFSRERLVSSDEVLRNLESLGPLEAASIFGCGPAKEYRWNKAAGSIGIIGAVTRAFCSGCNRLRLTAKGYLRPCLDDTAFVDLVAALRPVTDYERLCELIRRSVSEKPESHTMGEREVGMPRFCMAGIGG